MQAQEERKEMGAHVPVHLRQFVVEQHYDEYTPVDQAVWRYVMRRNHNFLGERAHEAYLNGLAAAGISIESIPNIKFMNESLARFGWGAVTVDGFIPPHAFMDFQAHRLLPIAADIRTDEHIAYTPAPDIIHESAGHAPITFSEQYRSYLKLIGEVGAKAISSKEDYEVYEAIRRLSILKEDPHAAPEEVEEAELNLDKAIANVSYASEATLISRLYWWTVEYGLIGDLDNPQIYGAGLLSSVGESMSCLKDDVKKIPFSLDCIHTDYDITKKQPQLFVCKDFDELIDAVKEFSKTMAYKVGGTESLQKAKQSENMATYVYSSGLQVSGVISDLLYDENGEAIFVRTTGGTALSFRDEELPGHDREYHHHGFSSPVGKLKDWDKPLEQFSDEELLEAGIVVSESVSLEFASGVHVQGTVEHILRDGGQILLIAFSDCTVSLGDDVLFQPEWGTYDMAVGERIVSVFAGAADPTSFQTGVTRPSDISKKERTYSPVELRRHELYQQVRDFRENDVELEELQQRLASITEELNVDYPKDWLIRLEILELLKKYALLPDLQVTITKDLQKLMEMDEENGPLIESGLELIA